jgi:hypothetical protein
MDSFREWVFEADENKRQVIRCFLANDGEFEFTPIRLTYLD